MHDPNYFSDMNVFMDIHSGIEALLIGQMKVLARQAGASRDVVPRAYGAARDADNARTAIEESR